MNRASNGYREFSCPQVPRTGWMAAAIGVTHGRATVEMLLERKRELLLQRTDGVLDLLQAWLTSATDFDTVWDLSFGRALRALESDEVDAGDATVEIALRLGARGRSSCWKATLSEERRLLWDNRWLLPAAREISFESNRDMITLELRTRDSERRQILRVPGEDAWSGDVAERVVQVGAGKPIALLPAHGVPREMIVEDDFHSIFEFPPVTAKEVGFFAAALEILGQHAPEYLEWVQGVLRGVLVCRCDHSRTRSSSWMHAPGIILASWSPNPITIAEMLVHESSHQYFHLLSRVGEAEDGTDVREYFSPAVQRTRRLSRILIGYHAFANVLLFYRALLRDGLAEDPHCRATEARLCDDVEALELPLRGNPALTEIGRDLVQPLMEQLRESRSGRVNA